MHPQDIRINAMIAYFFLGPIMLLAKKWTPLHHPFVRHHAKKSSIILLIAVGVFVLYSFLKQIFAISILGFSLQGIFLGLYMTALVSTLLFGAYQAYRGKYFWTTLESAPENAFNLEKTAISDEEKIRILGSFLPFVGIFLAKKYNTREIVYGRKVGNALSFLIILSIVLWSGMSSVTFLLLVAYIAVFVATGVFLFVRDGFFHLSAYDRIPSYHSIEAIISTAISGIFDFFRIAFWGEKKETTQERYDRFLAKYDRTIVPNTAYWTSPIIFGIPLANLLTIPSFFKNSYAIYRGIIAEGFFLSLFAVLIFFFGSNTSLLFLLFPIFTLIAEGRNNVHVRAPFTSIAWFFMELFHKSEQKIDEIKKEEKAVKYTYASEDMTH